MRWLPLLLLPVAAAAEDIPLDARGFERHVAGRTLTYSVDGSAYGIEQYLDDRRVVWSFLDGECREGRWYEAGEFICFAYEGREFPECWTFFLRGGALVARFENGPDVVETGEVPGPVLCHGPIPGV